MVRTFTGRSAQARGGSRRAWRAAAMIGVLSMALAVGLASSLVGVDSAHAQMSCARNPSEARILAQQWYGGDANSALWDAGAGAWLVYMADNRSVYVPGC